MINTFIRKSIRKIEKICETSPKAAVKTGLKKHPIERTEEYVSASDNLRRTLSSIIDSGEKREEKKIQKRR